MRKKLFKILVVIIVSSSLLGAAVPTFAAQTVVKDYPISSGVQYKQYTHTNTYTNSINHLAINLNDAYTKVGIGLPTTLTTRETTTSIAMRHSVERNRVVGAINAAFFDMAEGYPLFLLAKNNEILNGGVVSVGADQYLNQPTAFGVTASGSGAIDFFDFNVSMQLQGKSYELSGLNRNRTAGEEVVYTPQYRSSTTGTNEYGFEVVVDTGKPITSNYFGQTLTGVIKEVKPYGSRNSTIPQNGFILSFQGADWYYLLEGAIGEEVSINFSIDSLWRNAQFILASGPMLVKDGKPYIMMSTASDRATAVTSRTAVGISKDGKTIHYITVDGKQSHSKGMNMSQLANYLIELGVDRAINLDGGGSTTMGIRQYGSNNVVLVNKPSDGSERRVSATLQAISTAPTSKATQINFSRTRVGSFLAGSSATLTVNYLMDQYYNAVPFTNSQISLGSQNKTLSISGLTYKTTKAGDDRIYILHNGVVVQSFPVKTVAGPTTMTLKEGPTTVEAGKTASYSIASAKDADGKDILFDASQVKWSVEGNIGTISNTGVFTAGKTSGSGKIVATLGTKSVSQTVTVAKPSIFSDLPLNYQYQKEIEYLVQKSVISGYSNGTFQPNTSLKRAHAAVIISRALGLDTSKVKNPGFKDVPTTHTYYKEIAAVANAGIVSGKEGNMFDPSGTLTRGQMAKILTEAYNLSGTSSKVFKDVSSSDWTYKYIQALATNNITTGYQDGTFKPTVAISRAHFSVFLYRTIH